MPTPEQLEDAAARDATKALRERLEEITRRGLALYESMDETNPGSRAMVRNLLSDQLHALADSDVPDNVALLVRESAEQAFLAARLDAARQLSVAEPREAPALPDRADAQAVAVREELRNGARQMREAESPDDVLSAFSSSRRAVTRAEAAARFTVNEALSEGTKTVTEAYGVSRLWVPERDACVHCLAYAGEVAGPGEDFRGGLTFGAKPLHTGPVGGAPLHPNCRCRIVPYPASEQGSGKAEAYKREALRSILRGWSLPSESNRTRLDAAERALKGSALMPKSVQDYARRAVKKGSFPRGRDFPDSTERKSISGRQGLVLKAEPKPAPNGLASLPTRVVGRAGSGAERHDMLTKVNPKYGEPGYGINCVHVVAAAELRRRGYDVEATALPTALWGNRGRDMQDALGRWTAPEGGKRKMAPVPARGGLQTNTLAIVKSWGPGARGWIVLAWKDGGAHVFSAEVGKDGRPVLYDAQTGKVVEPRDYFGRAKQANVVRVDDLVPTDAVMEFVKPAVKQEERYKQMTPAERLRLVEGDF